MREYYIGERTKKTITRKELIGEKKQMKKRVINVKQKN